MTETDTEVTRVVFRKWPNGDILAMFPDVDWVTSGYQCMSYENTGQHSGASYQHCIRGTVPALPEKYFVLKKELESLGYNLKVIQRRGRDNAT